MAAEPSRSAPGYLTGAPLILAAIAWGWTGGADLVAAGVGALGWLLALGLRGPLAAICGRAGLGQARQARVLLWASGPVEEAVRLAALLLLAASSQSAVWLGLGWAFVEAALAAVNVVAVRRTLHKGGEAADQVRTQLAQAGSSADVHPGWAGLERASSTLAHVGFTLWIVWSPWMAVVAAGAHSALNAAAVAAMGRGQNVLLAEMAVAVGGIASIALGLWLTGLV